MNKILVCLLFSALLSASDQEKKAWCDVTNDRNYQVGQWVASQVAFNRMRVLDEQTKSGVRAVKKKDKLYMVEVTSLIM